MSQSDDRSRAVSSLRFLAAPTDAGYPGHVSGGRVLEWIDKAGFACASAWSGSYCVTAYVGNVTFSRPVEVGHLVEATAQVVHTGRSSMHILVTVNAGDPRDGVLTETTSCLVIFVAVDRDGRPTPVPAWEPADDLDRARQAGALRRIGVRAEIEAAMAGQHYTEAGTAPKSLLRFLAAPTDVNWGGKVHGGIVMRWADEAAHVLATSWTGSHSNVAVYVGGVRFYRPLLIGNLVEVDARLLHTSARSLHISVHIRSGDPAGPGLELCTHVLIIFVAPDAQRRATEIRHWQPFSAEDQALDEHARQLIQLRATVGDG